MPPRRPQSRDHDLFVNPYNKLSAHHRPVGAGAEYGVPGTGGGGPLDPRHSLNIAWDAKR